MVYIVVYGILWNIIDIESSIIYALFSVVSIHCIVPYYSGISPVVEYIMVYIYIHYGDLIQSIMEYVL